MGPKENPEDRKDRERQRRSATLDRRESAETAAAGLTTDLRAVYGLRGLSMFGAQGAAKSGTGN
jgi:hypothetical protein